MSSQSNSSKKTPSKRRKQLPPDLAFSKALKSFVGYLEGTQKADHTIKNYRFDLLAFADFLKTTVKGKEIRLKELGKIELDAFHDHLKGLGLKNNTRRRKLMTIRKFLSFLAGRNQLNEDSGNAALRVLAPAKIERIPYTVMTEDLIKACERLPCASPIQTRNAALLRTLIETGCQVSEIPKIRFTDFEARSGGSYALSLSGKGAREVPISRELYESIQKLSKLGDEKNVFLGFNKFGSMGAPITPRGIELLVRHTAEALGFPDLVPRTFRHSVVLYWHRLGISQNEIQARLGLKSAYAFRAYEVLFNAEAVKSKSETTSI
jgi:integrase/recombinase XerC